MIVAIRWVAHVWSVAGVGLVLLILAGEIFSPHALPPTADEWVGLFFFPFGVCAGMVIAWRRHHGWQSVALLRLYVDHGWAPAAGAYFALIAAPGALFLLVWGLARSAPETCIAEISILAQFRAAPPTHQEDSSEYTYWRKAGANRSNRSSARRSDARQVLRRNYAGGCDLFQRGPRDAGLYGSLWRQARLGHGIRYGHSNPVHLCATSW